VRWTRNNASSKAEKKEKGGRTHAAGLAGEERKTQAIHKNNRGERLCGMLVLGLKKRGYRSRQTKWKTIKESSRAVWQAEENGKTWKIAEKRSVP